MGDTNGGSENIHLQRLNRMEDVIQSMITLVHENLKAQIQFAQSAQNIINLSRAEIRDLLELQKEQRIDIMALFHANKELRENMLKVFEDRKPGPGAGS